MHLNTCICLPSLGGCTHHSRHISSYLRSVASNSLAVLCPPTLYFSLNFSISRFSSLSLSYSPPPSVRGVVFSLSSICEPCIEAVCEREPPSSCLKVPPLLSINREKPLHERGRGGQAGACQLSRTTTVPRVQVLSAAGHEWHTCTRFVNGAEAIRRMDQR